MVRGILAWGVLLIAAAGCGGPKLVDCDKIAAEQAACMDAWSTQSCEEENDECANAGTGEVLVLESCPLQFSCSLPRGTSGVSD
jgi:hypothetical protein